MQLSEWWSEERKRTMRAISVGTVTAPLALLTGWWLWPSLDGMDSPVARVIYTMQLLAAPAAVTFLMMFSCLRMLYDAKAENPFARTEGHRWELNQRILQNTVEQAWVFVPALLALSVRIDPAHAKILPVLVTVWTTGRVMFTIGYHISVPWRAVGFDWTLHPAMLTLGWFVWTLM